jgi:hypothetical protein
MVLHVTARIPLRSRKPIEWKLLTDLPVRMRQEAIEKIRWYAIRWKIETFHKILKSGCRAEESRLRPAERIVKILALFCIIARRILWLTQAHRTNPETAPQAAMRGRKIFLLDRLMPSADADEPQLRYGWVARADQRLGTHADQHRHGAGRYDWLCCPAAGLTHNLIKVLKERP